MLQLFLRMDPIDRTSISSSGRFSMNAYFSFYSDCLGKHSEQSASFKQGDIRASEKPHGPTNATSTYLALSIDKGTVPLSCSMQESGTALFIFTQVRDRQLIATAAAHRMLGVVAQK
jgi:hypothetical protein